MDLLLEATRRVEARHFWFRGLRRFLRPLLVRAVAGKTNARLLDCGCGTGVNLPLLARHGSAWAIDLNAYGLGQARERGCTRLARATVASLPFPGAAFDVVTSIDVLYSVPGDDERRAVREMFRVLKPGGAAVLNLAAMKILRGSHSVLAEELRRYDRKGTIAMLEEAGFQVERASYTNATLFPLVLAQRVLERLVGFASQEKAASAWTVPPAPVNETLAGLLALESVALRLMPMPFGSSLLVLARRPGK